MKLILAKLAFLAFAVGGLVLSISMRMYVQYQVIALAVTVISVITAFNWWSWLGRAMKGDSGNGIRFLLIASMLLCLGLDPFGFFRLAPPNPENWQVFLIFSVVIGVMGFVVLVYELTVKEKEAKAAKEAAAKAKPARAKRAKAAAK